MMSAATLALALLLVQPRAVGDLLGTGRGADAKALIDGGADVNARDRDGVTPLMRAASAGRSDMVRLLIAGRADVNAKTTGGATALMMASLGGYVPAVDALIAASADVNVKDNQGRTALMAAASSGERAAVDALLNFGADAQTADARGSTAITYAAAEGHANVIESLQKRGAKPSDAEMTLAAGRCNTTSVAAFLAGGMRVNPTDPNVAPPLVVAASGNCLETMELLIARGANLNATNSDGLTALIKATASG